jgi:hypothetical protein
MFPSIGSFMRKISAVGRAERVIAKDLTKVVQERKKMFDTYPKMDLIQLLLQQDQIRQQTEGV